MAFINKHRAVIDWSFSPAGIVHGFPWRPYIQGANQPSATGPCQSFLPYRQQDTREGQPDSDEVQALWGVCGDLVATLNEYAALISNKARRCRDPLDAEAYTAVSNTAAEIEASFSDSCLFERRLEPSHRECLACTHVRRAHALRQSLALPYTQHRTLTQLGSNPDGDGTAAESIIDGGPLSNILPAAAYEYDAFGASTRGGGSNSINSINSSDTTMLPSRGPCTANSTLTSCCSSSIPTCRCSSDTSIASHVVIARGACLYGNDSSCPGPTRGDEKENAATDRQQLSAASVAAAIGCSTASPAASSLPVINPRCLPSGLQPLQRPSPDTNASVWRAPGSALLSSGNHSSDVKAAQDAEEEFAVKVTPFFSSAQVARLIPEGGDLRTSSRRVAEVLLERDACVEAHMAVQVAQANARYVATAAAGAAAPASSSNSTSSSGVAPFTDPVPHEIFVQPRVVAVQHCPLQGTPRDLGHDCQLVVLYKYCRGGNVVHHLCLRAPQLIRSALGGAQLQGLSPAVIQRIAAGLARDLHSLALRLFQLVARVHVLGFVLNDLKLENVVYDTDVNDIRFIDAEAVQRCPLGSKLYSAVKCTDEYAAPEQLNGLWSDSSSDVHAAGASIKEALGILLDAVWDELKGSGQQAKAALLTRLEPLRELMEECTAAEAGARPSAAGVVERLQRFGRGED